MKILAIGTSNNTKSINRTLAKYVANLVTDAKVESLNIADYELPLFSNEREAKLGQPQLARAFYEKIANADGLVISFVEHNGSYTAAYKNLFDWTSRIAKNVYQDKPTVFLSTSPGPGGAKSVLKSAVESAGFFGAKLVGDLSVPSFNDNFDTEAGKMKNEVLQKQLEIFAEALKVAINAAGKSSDRYDGSSNFEMQD